jgi:hypothetical protein
MSRMSAVLVCLLPALALSAEAPAELKAALEKPGTITLYSLDPSTDKEKEKPKEAFHGVAVLGKTEVKGDGMKSFADTVLKAIEDPSARGARCFIPRHGIAFRNGDKVIDLVICFECSWVDIYIAGKKSRQTIGSDGDLLNKVLREAKVPLPKGPKSK